MLAEVNFNLGASPCFQARGVVLFSPSTQAGSALKSKVQRQGKLTGIMAATAANEKVLSDWASALPGEIARSLTANDQSREAALSTLTKFCDMQVSPDAVENMCKQCDSINLGEVRGLGNLLLHLAGAMLPQVWESVSRAFSAQLIRNQSFFKDQCDSTDFLPEPAANNKEFWEKVSQIRLPAGEHLAMEQMAKLLGSNKVEEVKELSKVLNVEKLTYKICEFINAASDKPIEDDTPSATKAEHFTALTNLAVEVVKGLAHVQHQSPSARVKEFVGKNILGRIVRLAQKCGKMVAASKDAIPPRWEQLVENRNASQIKTQMFSRKVHQAVAGDLDSVTAVCSSVEKIVKEFSMVPSLMQSSQLSVMKAMLEHGNVIKNYSTSLHGLNLLLHRLPAKSSREKAAALREWVGRLITLCILLVLA